MVSALFTTAFFRAARLICPFVAMSSNWSLVAPSSFSNSFTYSGAFSKSWLMVSPSSLPRPKELLIAS